MILWKWTCCSIQSWQSKPNIQRFGQQVCNLYIVIKTILNNKYKKRPNFARMWLLVLAPALLGSLTLAENDETDISGCCTHLAVTRWSCWLFGWWWELERIWGLNQDDYIDDFNDDHDVVAHSEGSASEHQANRLGEYKLTGVLADRPIYKNEERDEFLFYLRVSRF